MSRSFVNRGLACATTAMPPTTTKSTFASASFRMSRVGRNSGQLATRALSRVGDQATLVVHRLERVDALRRRELEVLADQALVDRRPVGLGGQRQPAPGGTQRAVEGFDGGVRRRILETGDHGLSDTEASRELSLGEAGGAAGVANEDGGCHGR